MSGQQMFDDLMRGTDAGLPDSINMSAVPDEPEPLERNDARYDEAIEYARSYAGNFDFMLAMRRAAAEDRPFSEKMVESILRCKARDIEWAAKRAAEAKLPEIEDGFYEVPANEVPDQSGNDWESAEVCIVKIKHAIHTSGRQFGLVLNLTTQKFEYVRGLINTTRKFGTKLTLEKAKELGHIYGMCMICGATLTDERSIERGIGPICAGRLS